MSFKLACPACGSRFAVGAEQLEQPLTSNLASATCPHCGARIAVDASAAQASRNEAPRRAPAPPHPPRPGTSATGTPLPNDVIGSDSALATPLRFGTRPLARPPKPQLRLAASRESEPELIDAEEIPQSSSDAPTLSVLMSEGKPAQAARKPRPGDDFLVNLSAGTQGILGAPTIDVTQLASAAPSAPEPLSDARPVPADPRRATEPLFDMGAVLKSPGNSPAPSIRDQPTAALEALPVPLGSPTPSSERSARVRKFVVPPSDASPPAKRRTRPGIWLGLATIALAGVAGAAIIASRERASSVHPPETELAEAPAVHTHAALPMNAVSAAVADAPPAESSVAAATPSTPPVQQVSASRAERSASNSGSAPSLSATRAKAVASSATEPASGDHARSDRASDEPALEIGKPEFKTPEAKNAPATAEVGTEFDRGAARAALESAATHAASCRKEGDPSGTASITITFAPSGRVTSATLQGPPFAGTATGGCIASAMRHATVPAFSGEHVTVTKTIVVE